jgi:phage terminase Nu1 subunit (DNA packaging protein)
MSKIIRHQSELSKVLGVSQPSISHWIDIGMPYRMEGMAYVFELEKVFSWLCEYSPRHKRWIEKYIEERKDQKE